MKRKRGRKALGGLGADVHLPSSSFTHVWVPLPHGTGLMACWCQHFATLPSAWLEPAAPELPGGHGTAALGNVQPSGNADTVPCRIPTLDSHPGAHLQGMMLWYLKSMWVLQHPNAAGGCPCPLSEAGDIRASSLCPCAAGGSRNSQEGAIRVSCHRHSTASALWRQQWKEELRGTTSADHRILPELCRPKFHPGFLGFFPVHHPLFTCLWHKYPTQVCSASHLPNTSNTLASPRTFMRWHQNTFKERKGSSEYGMMSKIKN